MNIKKITLLSASVALAFAGQCPFGFDSDDKADAPMRRVLQATTAQYPSEVLTCSKATKAATTDTVAFTPDTYASISVDVFAQHDAAADPAAYAACLVRLSGHDFMDYRKVGNVTSGGADGCVNFNDADNAGLAQCLATSNVQTIYDNYCDAVSLADFIVIAAEAVTAKTSTFYDANAQFNNGTLEARFRDRFRAGRTTLETCPDSVGLMPDAEKGCTDLQAIFIDHIFVKARNPRFRWKLTAAISGAHTIGQAKPENSGFSGTWSDAANQGVFNNDYYRSLILKGWAPQAVDATHHQWERVDSATAVAGALPQMMLSSDLCLAYQHNSEHDACVDEKVAAGLSLSRANGRCRGLQKKGGFLNAADVHCCAWTNTRALFNTGVLRRQETSDYCGVNITAPGSFEAARGQCCVTENATATSTGDCDSSKWPKGPAFGAVLDFAEREKDWLKFYQRAWWVATENGHTGLVRVAGEGARKRRERRKKMQDRRARKSSSRSSGGSSRASKASSSKATGTQMKDAKAKSSGGKGRGRK